MVVWGLTFAFELFFGSDFEAFSASDGLSESGSSRSDSTIWVDFSSSGCSGSILTCWGALSSRDSSMISRVEPSLFLIVIFQPFSAVEAGVDDRGADGVVVAGAGGRGADGVVVADAGAGTGFKAASLAGVEIGVGS